MRDKYNIIPMISASLLHVGIAASLLVVFEWPSEPIRPPDLLITATVVTDEQLPVQSTPEPEPEETEPLPEPDPIPEPPPEPEETVDEAEQARLAAEERKRQEDLEAERQRIAREEEAERRRRAEAEEERKRRREEEVERQRQEAERRRLAEIERQRLENERRRREAEEAALAERRQQEIDAEEQRLAAMNADEQTRYIFAIQQKITRNFIRPGSAPEELECVVNVRQISGGEVTNVQIVRCNGDDAVRRSVEAAVYKASPLPLPRNPANFQRDLQIIFKPEQ